MRSGIGVWRAEELAEDSAEDDSRSGRVSGGSFVVSRETWRGFSNCKGEMTQAARNVEESGGTESSFGRGEGMARKRGRNEGKSGLSPDGDGGGRRRGGSW